MSESVHLFPDVHAALGIKISDLGCIMAEVEHIEVTDYARDAGLDPARDLYVSANVAERFWINGAVAETGAHATLLYGLMQPGPVWREHVDALLADVDLSAAIEVDHVGIFDSPYPDEAYKCIVAHLRMTPELAKAHARLSYLPHINTFPGYRAHVTLAYVKDQPSGVDWAATTAEAWGRALQGALRDAPLRVTGIDYGGRP